MHEIAMQCDAMHCMTSGRETTDSRLLLRQPRFACIVRCLVIATHVDQYTVNIVEDVFILADS